VAHVGDPAELLGVEVEQIAHRCVLVPLDGGRRLQAPAARHADAAQDAGRRRRIDRQRAGDLAACPALPAEHFGGEPDLGFRLSRAAGGRLEPSPTHALLSTIPLLCFRPTHLRAVWRDTPNARATVVSASPRSTRPTSSCRRYGVNRAFLGTFIRVSNDLAATTFPRSAWVNNLSPRHS
jgi:hypothetical protein